MRAGLRRRGRSELARVAVTAGQAGLSTLLVIWDTRVEPLQHESSSTNQATIRYPPTCRSAFFTPAVCEAEASPASATSAPAATVAPRLHASSATARTRPASPRCIWRRKSWSANAASDRPPEPSVDWRW